ncbi:DNA-binding SARP family transcriptional activator [Nocardia tenerifensis]|uniref:DNA-binding SARP family transcriptional activator n=1 Tax=Nocardia tenerifensis TaxID=228006 RepID=A0A318KA97_9NOCA|nr:AfsR/SARP family transcriptional regulator [Nocardia tenerifensis]PXX66725.1 DNA-binding SARP family transcriptional activator [Nocardia tenerifensis]
MARLSFGVLGPVRAERDGQPLALKGPRHRAVLARLLVARGRVVSVDQLIDDLWERPPQGAVGAIQTFVADLRRALEPDRAPRAPAEVLVSVAPGYALRTEPEAVDADRFEAAVARAAELLAAEHFDRALETLDAALALWQGSPYAEFAEYGWARAEVDRLDGLRALCVEHRAAALIGLARPAEAVPALNTLLTEHPLREHAWRLLAVALYRSGRQSDALAALRRIRQLLRTELGADPGPELQRVEADILSHAPHLQADTRTPPQTGDFVGRRWEFAAIQHAAGDAARHSRVRSALVAGEAGAGKTALAEQISSALAASGWITARGESPAELGAPPGWAWTRILSALTAVAPALDAPRPARTRNHTTTAEPAYPRTGTGGPGNATSDTAAADPAHIPAGTHDSTRATSDTGTADSTHVPAGTYSPAHTDNEEAASDPAEARFLFHRAAVEYVEALARQAPVLLVFDDIHNAGTETLDLLTALVTGGTAGPVLILATYRSTEISAELTAALGKVAPYEPVRVYLSGLSEADTAALVGEIAGPDAAERDASRIHRRSNGNPFFVRELARLLRDEGPDALDAIPAGVREVIRHRMATLPQSARTLVQQAAVFGEEVDRELLADLTGDEGNALDSIEIALAAGLFTEQASGALQFTHALVRDTVYRDISGPRRAQWHAEIGALLESLGATDVSVLAHHFVRAHSRATAARAARYAAAAAVAAERGFALTEAVRQWRATLDALDRLPEPDLSARLDATVGLARALAVTGHLAEARRYRGQASTQVEHGVDPVQAARVISAFDIPAVWTANDDPELSSRVVTAAEHTLARLPAENRALRAKLDTTIALELRGADDDRGRRAARDAETIARTLDDPALLAFALNGRFMHTFQRAGLSADRGRIGDELIVLSRQHRLVTFEVLGELIAMQAACATADFTTADDHARAADQLATDYELPMVGVFTHWYTALRTSLTGSPRDAETAYRAAAKKLTGSGMPGVEQGLLPLALLCLRLRHGLPTDDPTAAWGPYEPWVRPILLLDNGLHDEAATALKAVPDSPRDLLLELRTCLVARAALALGDEPVMRRCHSQLSHAAMELAGACSGLVTLEPVAHYLAQLAAALGRPEAADEHRRQALAIARKANSPHLNAAVNAAEQR